MGKLYPLLLILLILAISGCVIKGDPSLNTTSDQAQAQAAATPKAIVTPTYTPVIFVHENSTVYVIIKGSEFNPSELRIINGTTVKWQNMDDAFHAINGTDFNSPVLDKREIWAYTFNKTGTFEYGCNIHLWMKHGRIIVE